MEKNERRPLAEVVRDLAVVALIGSIAFLGVGAVIDHFKQY